MLDRGAARVLVTNGGDDAAEGDATGGVIHATPPQVLVTRVTGAMTPSWPPISPQKPEARTATRPLRKPWKRPPSMSQETPQLTHSYARSSEVANAQASGSPVVALESTIITHGMPYPQNLEVARQVEEDVRAAGATPATMAVIAGGCTWV